MGQKVSSCWLLVGGRGSTNLGVWEITEGLATPCHAKLDFGGGVARISSLVYFFILKLSSKVLGYISKPHDRFPAVCIQCLFPYLADCPLWTRFWGVPGFVSLFKHLSDNRNKKITSHMTHVAFLKAQITWDSYGSIVMAFYP